jgi:murein tripeptide amidase MpaA
MIISSDFDSGNIIFLRERNGQDIDLEIRKDSNSDFFQWFYFKASELEPGTEYSFHITNAGKSSYPEGWKIQNIPFSEDGKNWKRVKSHFQNGILSFSLKPIGESAEFAYFVPYQLDRHKKLIETAKGSSLFHNHIKGKSADNRDLDLIHLCNGKEAKKKVWILARQHPGESMAEWFMEGLIERLVSKSDSGIELFKEAELFLIPNINPDGSYLGNLRSNARGANLNREWDRADPERSPEVLFALQQMDEYGVDICLDIHGDEDIPYVFGSGAEGNPGFNEKLAEIDSTFRSNWQEINPDFQMEFGYDRDDPGKADLSLCTNQVSQRYNCFALTIEMPFTDNHNDPDEEFGWSPEKSMKLGRSSVDAILSILPMI